MKMLHQGSSRKRFLRKQVEKFPVPSCPACAYSFRSFLNLCVAPRIYSPALDECPTNKGTQRRGHAARKASVLSGVFPCALCVRFRKLNTEAAENHGEPRSDEQHANIRTSSFRGALLAEEFLFLLVSNPERFLTSFGMTVKRFLEATAYEHQTC